MVELAARLRARWEVAEHPLRLRRRTEVAGGTRLAFATAAGEGWLLEPQGAARHPAILYIHAHGNAYGIGARRRYGRGGRR